MKNAFPFPELVDPDERQWTVRDAGTPRVNYDEVATFVPLSETKVAACVRAHELAHIKWTGEIPVKFLDKNRINGTLMNAVEDMRVNELMRVHADVSVEPVLIKGTNNILAMLKRNGLSFAELGALEQAGILLSTIGSSCYGHFQNGTPKVRDAVEQARTWLFGDGSVIPDLKTMLDVTQWLQSALNIDGNNEAKSIISFAWPSSSGEFKATTPFVLHKPALTRRTPMIRQAALRKRKAADRGAVMFAPYRWCVDKHIFDTRKRQTRGTVLLDVSGSMNVQNHHLKQLVEANPFGTIAMHATSDEGTGNDVCHLWILAREGKRVAKIPAHPGGNGGDIFALKWLLKQPKPHFWMTDFGIGDRNKCMEMMRKHKVGYAINVNNMIEVIQGKTEVEYFK